MLSTKTTFLHSLLRSPDLLAAGSTGSIFKGRRNNDLRFFSPERTWWMADSEPCGRCTAVSSRRCLFISHGFLLVDTGSPLQETGEAVSFLITSLRKRRVPDFCDPTGAGCVQTGLPSPAAWRARGPCVHTPALLGFSPAASNTVSFAGKERIQV